MIKFIEQLKSERTPHERRALATRVAGILTALLFVFWVTTLGVRLSEQNINLANQEANMQNVAATLIAIQGSSTPGQ
ncbi:MAG: hypothetical protein G01um101456_79 [Parcubacteria group bacterium Gr01-1014_56]|nr:MAG: hypothetical protein G01um101456_79 [Parcubacteria group bacterium Gr01-1014_56]